MAEPFYRIKVIEAVFPSLVWASFLRVSPPKEAKELGDRHTLRRGDLRKGNLEVWEVVWCLTTYKRASQHLWGKFHWQGQP